MRLLQVLSMSNSNSEGSMWDRWQWITGVILIALSEGNVCGYEDFHGILTSSSALINTVTLQLRLYALFEQSKKLLIVLSIAFVVSMGSTIGIMAVLTSRERGRSLKFLSFLLVTQTCL